MPENLVQRALDTTGRAVGAFVQSPNPEAVEILGYLGFDFVVIDMEHGALGFDRTLEMIRAADAAHLTAIIRVPRLDEVLLGQVLDAGAQGVIVPRVRTAEDVRRVVAAARYDADAGRGACPLTRAAQYHTAEWPAFVRRSNENTTVWVLIETPDAVENFPDIVAVEGLDGVMFGPFDLAHALGYGGDTAHPRVVAAMREMLDEARVREVECVGVAFSPYPAQATEELQRWADAGCRVLVTGGDRGVLAVAFGDLLEAARGVQLPG